MPSLSATSCTSGRSNEAAQGARGGAAFRSPRDAAARHRALAPAGARGLDHRLGERASGSADRGSVPPRRLRRLRSLLDQASLARPARDLGLPADRTGPGRSIAASGERRRYPPHHGHDGRADRRPAQPDRGQQPRAPQAVLLVRAPRDRARAGEVPGLHAARLSRIPAAPRLRGDEPGPAPHRALGLLPQARHGRWRVGRGAPALLRRVQRGARHAGRVLPRHGEDRVSGLRAAQRPHVRARGAGAAAGDPRHRAPHHRRRARRHLG